jgi:hypothetical protein
MAVIGKEAIRITEPWILVTQLPKPVGSLQSGSSGNLVAGTNRDRVFDGRGPIRPDPDERMVVYLLAMRFTTEGHVARRVVDALTAQGYRIERQTDHQWCLALDNPEAPEDSGESAVVDVSTPPVSKLFAKLQSWADAKRARRLRAG